MTREQLSTPCYVVSEKKLKENLQILKGVIDRTGCKILLAQKAFSMYALYPFLGEYLDGATASGLFEAKLGYESFGKENHIYSPAYRDDEIDEILSYCDHIVFNSFAQLEKFQGKAVTAGKSIGLRINPQCSTQGIHTIYDPCAIGSRLGVTKEHFHPELLTHVDGLHFHTLCEQDADDLKITLDAVESQFGAYLHKMKWINFGGGHHITKEGYHLSLLEENIRHIQDTYQLQVYLEPGEAIALCAGELLTTVLEVVDNQLKIAILDTSAACHMPDVLEMPYRPPLAHSGMPQEQKYTYRLAGPTCLAGDIIGDYSFTQPLVNGTRLSFEDMAIYSMVKNNTFNGMCLPSIVYEHENGSCEVIRKFGFDDFRMRLS